MAPAYNQDPQTGYSAYGQLVHQPATAPVVESASATTTPQESAGPAIYVAFVVVTVLLCLVCTQLGGLAGRAMGQLAGELYEEYGDELLDLEGYQELQELLGDDDPVSPDASDFLDGGGTPTSTIVPTRHIARSIS